MTPNSVVNEAILRREVAKLLSSGISRTLGNDTSEESAYKRPTINLRINGKLVKSELTGVLVRNDLITVELRPFDKRDSDNYPLNHPYLYVELSIETKTFGYVSPGYIA